MRNVPESVGRLWRLLPEMGGGSYIVLVLVIVAVLTLTWMVLRTPDAGMRFSVLGLLSLDIFRGRRDYEPDPPEEEPPGKE